MQSVDAHDESQSRDVEKYHRPPDVASVQNMEDDCADWPSVERDPTLGDPETDRDASTVSTPAGSYPSDMMAA